ncbi:MAG TPA: hypothetical protein VKV21_14400 [Solirubrobacteraceae bacterium]|nr:hypothetical protein [Solirubrobacteraceae bacterium]
MSLHALREALIAHGGTVAALVRTPFGGQDGAVQRSDGPVHGSDGPVHGYDGAARGPDGAASQPGVGAPQRAARGPRTRARAAEYELLLEMILEGSLLHYGLPRVVATEDRDLALLLGDQLYALGLARLAEIGDLDSVRELSDLISLLSQAQLQGDERLARAIWEAGATAIGWGATPEHEAAKELARAGDAAAVPALLSAARAA